MTLQQPPPQRDIIRGLFQAVSFTMMPNNDTAPPSPDTVAESDYDYKNDPRPVSL